MAPTKSRDRPQRSALLAVLLVAYAVLLITGARLGESHGYKRLFLTGIAVFGLS